MCQKSLVWCRECSTRFGSEVKTPGTMEEARKKVIGRLSDLSVEQLTTLCGTENIIIPPAKLNRKSSIENLILLFLSSDAVEDSHDDGLELFTRLGAQIDTMLKTKETVKTETADTKAVTKAPVTEGTDSPGTSTGPDKDGNRGNGSQVVDDSTRAVRSRVVHRLKEFKIEGKIGHGESPLSYQNIEYQVNDG